MFFFNPEAMIALTPSARYSVGTFSGSNGKNSDLVYQNASLIKSYNSIIGLTGFYYKVQTYMNF